MAPHGERRIPVRLVIRAKLLEGESDTEPDARQAELACTPLRGSQQEVSDPPMPILGDDGEPAHVQVARLRRVEYTPRDDPADLANQRPALLQHVLERQEGFRVNTGGRVEASFILVEGAHKADCLKGSWESTLVLPLFTGH
jgi:hypothetical protein